MGSTTGRFYGQSGAVAAGRPLISKAQRLPNALVGSGVGGCEQVDSVVGRVGNEYSTDQTGQAVAI